MDENPDVSKEFIEEFFFDNSLEDRRLELFNQIYGEGSSTTGRRVIYREREACHEHLQRDYFAQDPVYPLDTFRRRFRMGRHVFLRIVDALSNFDPYFQQRVDVLGRKGLSPLQKCTAAMRILAYGVGADAVDDYVRIGKSTAIECLKNVVTHIILIFENEYLRKPNSNDVQRLLKMGEARGFPGMMGSIDYRSPIFDDVLEGRAPEVNYNINGNNYGMGYYLTDGIYPEWATFVKTIPRPQGEKRKLFSKYQEGQRKDFERAFGVLQSRFAVVRSPARFWDKDDLAKIMRACMILHNMIVEDERDTYATPLGPLPSYDDAADGLPPPNLGEEPLASYEMYIERTIQIRDRQKHRQLQSDLVEHIKRFHNGD
ncbi:uncharacterized protein LOC141685089 [Apium graveolens]|uniref:uncharacterized protein LOC141685089 n=1 Tax=Apium graveolens TaxID=4045 RepID=UPI003D7BCD33